MSLTYGFYNSFNHDRVYDARDVSRLFDGLITDGIFMSIGGQLMVKANNEFMLSVDPGRAWFNHTWIYNDADYLLTVEQPGVILDRIDAVVLEVNETESVRANSIFVLKGTDATEPTKPELTNTELIHQYPLAYITVKRNATEIKQEDIENCVGLEPCPFVTGIVEGINIDDLIAQWKDEWENWKTNKTGEFDSFSEEYMNRFKEWFQGIKDTLSEDQAGHLQAEIDELKENNGLNLYTQSESTLTGSGLNGKFKCKNAGVFSSFTISGQSYTVASGEETEVELTADTWYIFILDEGSRIINFTKGGGGSSNFGFTLKKGLEKPSSPQENTIWVKTENKLSGNIVIAEGSKWPKQDDPFEDGDIWIVTTLDASTRFSGTPRRNATAYIINTKGTYEIGIYCLFIYKEKKWHWVYSELYFKKQWTPLRTTFDPNCEFNVLLDSDYIGNVGTTNSINLYKYSKHKQFIGGYRDSLNYDGKTVSIGYPYEVNIYPGSTTVEGKLNGFVLGQLSGMIRYICHEDILRFKYMYQNNSSNNYRWVTTFQFINFGKAYKPPFEGLNFSRGGAAGDTNGVWLDDEYEYIPKEVATSHNLGYGAESKKGEYNLANFVDPDFEYGALYLGIDGGQTGASYSYLKFVDAEE